MLSCCMSAAKTVGDVYAIRSASPSCSQAFFALTLEDRFLQALFESSTVRSHFHFAKALADPDAHSSRARIGSSGRGTKTPSSANVRSVPRRPLSCSDGQETGSALFASCAQLGSLFSGFMQGAIYSSLNGKQGLSGWQCVPSPWPRHGSRLTLPCAQMDVHHRRPGRDRHRLLRFLHLPQYAPHHHRFLPHSRRTVPRRLADPRPPSRGVESAPGLGGPQGVEVLVFLLFVHRQQPVGGLWHQRRRRCVTFVLRGSKRTMLMLSAAIWLKSTGLTAPKTSYYALGMIAVAIATTRAWYLLRRLGCSPADWRKK